MKIQQHTLLAAALMAMGCVASHGVAADGRFKAQLSGYQEVPALSSPGAGRFVAKVRPEAIEYTLSYEGLHSGVLFSHIHFGKRATNGSVIVFLCSNAASPPVPTPACPATGGSVSGVLGPADVVGPAAQGIDPGEFDELVAAMRAGATYVNVHTNDFPPGELRGQIGRGAGRGDD